MKAQGNIFSISNEKEIKLRAICFPGSYPNIKDNNWEKEKINTRKERNIASGMSGEISKFASGEISESWEKEKRIKGETAICAERVADIISLKNSGPERKRMKKDEKIIIPKTPAKES